MIGYLNHDIETITVTHVKFNHFNIGNSISMPNFPGTRVFRLIDPVFLILISGAILLFLSPSLLFLDSTATGGDTASHVFTAWYLKHQLLPHGALTGWCMGNLGGFPMLQNYFPLPFVMMVGLSWIMPFNIAFKLGTILGVLSLPWAAWFFFRRLRQPWPVPLAGAILSLPFLFMEGQSIWGGTILSALSGTFCYSMGFSLALVFLGCLYGHFYEKRRPVLCALILALTGFCHGYALLFAGFGSLFFLLTPHRFLKHLKELFIIHTLAVGFMSFWLVPLILNLPWTTKFGFVWNFSNMGQIMEQVFPVLTWPFIILSLTAPLFFTVSVHFKDRGKNESAGTAPVFVYYLALTGLMLYALGYRINLVDVRFLPFFQFFMIIAGAFVFRHLNGHKRSTAFFMVFFLCATLLWIHSRETSVRAWSRHNFKGFENMPLHKDFMAVMDYLKGSENDSRVVYEHSPLNEPIGSIRAFESLPFFSGRSTLEGLYLQASLLSPYIFSIQAELSAHPSMPLADYVYPGFDLNRAIPHLDLFHVGQIILIEPESQAAALNNPAYDLVYQSGPFMVFNLAGQKSAYVEELSFKPNLITQSDFRRHFFTWFRKGNPAIPLVYIKNPGTIDLERMVPMDPSNMDHVIPQPLNNEPANLRVHMSQDEIVIDQARPGLPLLIKVSYHPNWKATGADTIYLASPGFMLVYPTAPHVLLRYGPSFPEHLGLGLFVLTLASLAGGLYYSAHRKTDKKTMALPEPLGWRRILIIGSLGLGLVIVTRFVVPSSYPVPQFLKAQKLFSEQRYTQAAVLFKDIDHRYTETLISDEALFHLALCYFKTEQWQTSLGFFQDLLSRYPESRRAAEALFHMGECCNKTGLSDKALTYFKTIIRDFAPSPWATRARSYLNESDHP